MSDDTEVSAEFVSRLSNMTRREVIAAMSAVGAAAALGLPDRAAAAPAKAAARRAAQAQAQARLRAHAQGDALASRAAAVAPHGGDIGAIEHVVFLMMENRSYDHFFGTYHKGRGYDDHPKHSLGTFAQDYPKGTKLSPRKKLLPFHLDSTADEECTRDLTHNWGPMHECWNRGKMDRWVKFHTSAAGERNPDGALTMGYYTRKDIPFYWALADHFTLSDAYHCSILGPTHPNRLMAQTGTIDPAGHHGGPITDTNFSSGKWTCTWTTVQELLEDKGVPWKVYHPDYTGTTGRYAELSSYSTWDPMFYDPSNPVVMGVSDHVLPYFKAFKPASSPLHQKAFLPTFPNDFVADCTSGQLPSVSWIIPPLGFDDHPSAPPNRGMWFVQEVLHNLVANKKLWSKTAVFFMYDENDGFFDHVSPPTPPKGTPGEFLTAKHISAETNGIRGPLGLGLRVPMITISPFSRGHHIASELFDHTSQLLFLEQRFGIHVPNISKWRRHKVGDLTSTMFRSKHDASMPKLPKMSIGPVVGAGSCKDEDSEFGGASPSIPTKQRMPTQHGTTVPAGHYFAEAPTSTDRVPLSTGRNNATKKSGANALAHGRERVKPDAKRNR
jgi:phospholipase C